MTLRDARRKARMTQEALAAKSSLDQTTISSLETFRHTNPTNDTINALAKALGIAPSKLRFTAPEPGATVRADRDKAGHGRKSSKSVGHERQLSAAVRT